MLFNFHSHYLCAIGCERVFSLRPWSARILTGFLVTRNTWETARVFRDLTYKAITFFGPAFQPVQLSLHNPTSQSRNPPRRKARGLDCFLFARRYWGNRVRFLFLRVLRWFTSPGLTSSRLLYSAGDIPMLLGIGFPIRKSPGQSLLAAHRSISLLATSFVACSHLVILHKPFVA